MVNYAAAEAAGMAITVTQADLRGAQMAPGRRAAAGARRRLDADAGVGGRASWPSCSRIISTATASRSSRKARRPTTPARRAPVSRPTAPMSPRHSTRRRPTRNRRRSPTNWRAPARGCSCCSACRSRVEPAASRRRIRRRPGARRRLAGRRQLRSHDQRLVECDDRLHAALLLEPDRQLADADRRRGDRTVARLRRALSAAGRPIIGLTRRQHAVRHPSGDGARFHPEGQFAARTGAARSRSTGSALTGTGRSTACRRCATQAPKTCTRCSRCSRGRWRSASGRSPVRRP